MMLFYKNDHNMFEFVKIMYEILFSWIEYSSTIMVLHC